MKTVDVELAKEDLERLLEEAARGEEIVILRSGAPFVRLVACSPAQTQRLLGGWEGRVRVAADFDEPID